MKQRKIISLFLVIFSLIITSCSQTVSQDYSSLFVASSSSFSTIPSSEQTLSNEQAALKPISEEVMSFYSNNISLNGGSGSIPSRLNISSIYNSYKQSPEEFNALMGGKTIFTLNGENKYHCYYVTKDVFEAVQNGLNNNAPRTDNVFPWRGLTVYIDSYKHGSWSEELKNKQIMEADLDISFTSINIKNGDYYLLDIVRFYSDSQYNNFFFVDFVQYDKQDGEALIRIDSQKNSFKFCNFKFLPRTENPSDYAFVITLNNTSFEIILESNVEVVKERLNYLHTFDQHYYDEIEECIINKIYVGSGSNFDGYDVTFDYNKLATLFGL